ncbi:MAG: MauE/DoxX family redox-associated membrane protein [Thermoanaerobaculia bacterium]
MRTKRFSILYARLAPGSAFLSAVAARFGLWLNRGPHPFAQVIRYTGEVSSFLPAAMYPFLAVAATVAETSLGIALVAGFRLRWTALASAILLALFGTAMAISGGIKSSLDASVFSASAAALLLSLLERIPLLLDQR